MQDTPLVVYPPKCELSIYYECVGRVAMGWASYETRLNHAIWRLAGVEQYAGACLTAQIVSPSARFRALIALAKFRGASDAHIKTLRQLNTKADGVARQRNRLVHDPAYTKDDDTYRLHITADRAIDFGMKPTDTLDFRDVEIKINGLIRKFTSEMDVVFAELPPYDDRSFQLGEGIEIGSLPD